MVNFSLYEYVQFLATNVLCLKGLPEKVQESYKYLHIWASQKSLFGHHKKKIKQKPYLHMHIHKE